MLGRYIQEPVLHTLRISARSTAQSLMYTPRWTFLNVSQFILGIRPDYDGLTVDPCIPSKLDGFTAKRDFRGVSYHITVKNPNHVEKGVLSMIVDGQPVEGTTIPFSAEKKDVNVEVTMG